VPAGKLEEELGIDVLAATTTSEAVALKDRAPEAVASAEMRTCTPTPAVDRTRTLTCSSAAWSTGKAPTAQVARSGWGQTLKPGVPTSPSGELARTETARLFAFVDHTQITKVASWPALTSPALESDWTRAQSCGVTRLCFFFAVGDGLGLGELDVGVGVGEGELEVELGFGEGDVEVEDFGFGVPEELEGGEEVAVALDEGLSLADVLGEADEFADLSRDEELTSAAAG